MDIIEIINNYSNCNKIAHIYRESQMSYKVLKEASDALACYILEKCAGNTKPILIYGHKEHLMLISFLACIKAGHGYIPVDSYTPIDRVEEIITNSSPGLIFNVSENLIGANHINLFNKNDMDNIIAKFLGQVPNSCYKLKPDETCYIIYTSGSTGKPKGVQISLSNLTSFIKWGLKICSLSDNDVFMNQAPFSFDLSVMDLYLSLASGSTLFSIDKDMISNTKELFNYLGKSNISIWVSTPSFAEMCLSSEHFNQNLIPHLRQTLFCGETLSNNCVTKLYKRFENITVTNCYGPTETTVAISSVNISEDMCNTPLELPVGNIKEDCNVIITNVQNENYSLSNICENILKDGEKGEIIILGLSVGLGYHNDVETTRKKFIKIIYKGKETFGYRTGDEGYIVNNMLYYCGRIDNQIKLNGYRIELEDIENNFRKLPLIKNAVVFPFYKNNKIQYLTSVVVLNEETEESEFAISSKIKKQLKVLLPDYMIPRKIITKNYLPMNSNGKVDRKSLMEEI